MIDPEGYRPNVGIILTNKHNQVFWAQRVRQDSWQFPQGGIRHSETPEQAMYRELREEIGLKPDDVEILGSTSDWLRYRLPEKFLRKGNKPLCIGQKQIWFLLRLTGSEDAVRFDCCETAEFENWRWVDYWLPVKDVIFFKKKVYKRALTELKQYISC